MTLHDLLSAPPDVELLDTLDQFDSDVLADTDLYGNRYNETRTP